MPINRSDFHERALCYSTSNKTGGLPLSAPVVTHGETSKAALACLWSAPLEQKKGSARQVHC